MVILGDMNQPSAEKSNTLFSVIFPTPVTCYFTMYTINCLSIDLMHHLWGGMLPHTDTSFLVIVSVASGVGGRYLRVLLSG
jgi:hypothetical protein